MSDFRRQAWWKRLVELRPRFNSRAYDDLKYIRLGISVTLDEWEVLRTDSKALHDAIPIEEAEVPEDIPILSDEFTCRYFRDFTILSSSATGMVINRHILYGTADEASFNDYKAWADDAGWCIAVRPTSQDKNGSGPYRWLDYVTSTAIQRIPGCRLHADCPALLHTQHELRRVILPRGVFLASVDVIDALDEHYEVIVRGEQRDEPKQVACRILGQDWHWAGSKPSINAGETNPEKSESDLQAEATEWLKERLGDMPFKIEVKTKVVEILFPPRIGPPPHTLGRLHRHMKDCQEIMEHNRRYEREESTEGGRKIWLIQNAIFDKSIRDGLASIEGFDRLRSACYAETGEEPDASYIGKVMGRLSTAPHHRRLDEASALTIEQVADALGLGVGRSGSMAKAEDHPEHHHKTADVAAATALSGAETKFTGGQSVGSLAGATKEKQSLKASPPLPIILDGLDGEPIVRGKTKPRLTPGQYRVVKAMLDAAPDRLSTDQLARRSETEDPIGMIDRLRRDKDWAAVLDKPGQAHGGYGLRLPKPKKT